MSGLYWIAANMQNVETGVSFYDIHNKKNDILVKFLLNEIEVRLPLKSNTGPYYSWEEVRAFLLVALQ